MKSWTKNRQGMTLIEILIVVIILGVLASLVVPRLTGKTKDAKIQAARSDIEGGLGVALDLYELDMGEYPKSLQDLVQNPGQTDDWQGPYLKKKKIPLDPWGNTYLYSFPGSNNTPDYDLYSKGPDGVEGTGDDIKNWE